MTNINVKALVYGASFFNKIKAILLDLNGYKVKCARKAIKQRYQSTIPSGLVWLKGDELEDQGLHQKKTQTWLAQRLYLAQLGVYAAERLSMIRNFVVYPVLFLFAIISHVLFQVIFPSGLIHQYAFVFYVGIFIVFACLATGLFPLSYRIFLPRRLISGESFDAVECLIARCVLRIFPEETPRDLQDRFRNLVIDAEGDSVSGQILSMDLEIPFFANELFRMKLAWLIGAIVLLMSIVMPFFFTLMVFIGLGFVYFFSDGPLQIRSALSAEASSECASEHMADTAGRKYFKQQEEARQEQIANCIQDRTPFVKLGETTGLLYERRCSLAPSEAALPFGLSINDLSMHMLTLGATGTGKTSGVIRPILKQWIKNDAGGLLVLDGKGQLPKEISTLDDDYQLISPSSAPYNPIENLTADEIADSFAAMFAGKSSDSYWEDSAILTIRFAAVLLENSKQDYTLFNLYRLCTQQECQIEVAKTVPNNAQGNLRMAIEYFAKDLPKMPERTRGSIISVVRTWMLTLIGNQDLNDWVNAPKGAQVEDVLLGKHMGICLPESQFGKGGVLISILTMRRLYRAIKNRGDSWKQDGQEAVLLIADEVQNLVSEHDLDILPVARSLGLYCCWSTQNIDGIEQRLGKEDAEQLVGNLSNLVALPTRTQRSEEFISRRLGKIWRSEAEIHDSFADAYADIGKYVFNGADKWSTATEYQRKTQPYSRRVARNTFQDSIQAVNSVMSTLFKALSLTKKGEDNTLLDLNQGRINHVKIGTFDLVHADEINTLLSLPNTAIAQVIRGRVIRRDVIKLQPEYN
ncbi:MAG: type IV secretory system conjugative DNA transfer family protein [Gammaproteobacteria bacterium]